MKGFGRGSKVLDVDRYEFFGLVRFRGFDSRFGLVGGEELGSSVLVLGRFVLRVS